MRGEQAIEADPARLTVREDGQMTVLEPHGDWLVDTVGPQDAAIRAVEANTAPGNVAIDLTHLGRIDTAAPTCSAGRCEAATIRAPMPTISASIPPRAG